MTETLKSYTTRQYPPNPISDNGTYSDNNLTYTSTITEGTDISGVQYGSGSYIVKYSSYKDNNSSNTIDPNLVVWYKFDNNATDMLLDSTTNGHNLINTTAVFDNTNFKKGNGSISFNNQVAKIPTTFNLSTVYNNNGITFSLWFKFNPTSQTTWSRFFEFNNSTTANNRILLCRQASGSVNSLQCTLYNNGVQTLFITPSTFTDNQWHHIIWSISSSGIWNIYIDGIKQNCNITMQIPNLNSWPNQFLGASPSDSHPYFGNMDDFRIYKKVVTDAEVTTIYNSIDSSIIPNPWIIFKNDPAYYKKIDISSSQPNWNGNYDLVSPYSYLDNSYLINNFTGDYVTIKLPQKIYLTKYVLCSSINNLKKAPQHFRIYGSIDGVNWNQIVERQLTPTSYVNTPIPNSTYSTGYYTDEETKSTVAYDYYGIVVNKLLGPLDASEDASNNNLSFSLWNIYGTNNLKEKSYFEFGVVMDTSKTIGSSLKDGLIKTNNSNIFIKSGNTNTSALTIGSNNKVAIGKNIANEALDVSGSIIADEYRIKNQSYPIIDVSSNIAASGNVDISGNLTLNTDKFVVNSSTGNLSIDGSLDISKNININTNKAIIDSSGNIKSQGNFDLSNNININNYVLVDTSGSVIFNNTLDISNNATFRNNLDIKGNIKSNALTTNSSLNKVSIRNTSVDPSYNFHVTGNTRLEGNLDVDGNIIIVDTVQQTSEQFIINNDGDTVALTANQIGAQPIIDLRDDGKSVFYLADNGLLGLGTTTPSYTVDVSGSCFVQQSLDVSGNLNISGNAYLSENIQANDILDVSQNMNINNKIFVDPSGNLDICGNVLIYGYLISNGNNANSGGFQQDGDAIINGNLRVLYNIDISKNLRVLDTFIVDASGNIKSKGKFDLSNNLSNGNKFTIDSLGNIYSAESVDISGNFTINNGVFSADVSGNIIVNGYVDISKNLYVNGNKFTIDQNGNITAMGNFDISHNFKINTNKFIVDVDGNIKSAGNLDISNNFIINNGTFKIDNTGNISSQGNFDISGNMSINGTKFTVSNTGNIKSTGTLDISNNFTINNDKFKVDNNGNTIAKGNIDISNNLSIGNNKFNVDISGNIKSSGTLDISKNLKIGSSLLTVDHQNKRVGINTTTPEYSLDISGQIVTNKAIMGSTYDVSSSQITTPTTIDVSAVTITMNNTPVTPMQINTNDYYYAFTSTTANYNFTCTKDISCDILLIGGGGGGAFSSGGGGGSGSCIVSMNNNLSPGTYNIKVGAGGTGGIYGGTYGGTQNGANGEDSKIGNIFLAKGGGGGGHADDSIPRSGLAGGSSGGGGGYDGGSSPNQVTTNIVNGISTGPVITSNYAVYGNKGGTGFNWNSSFNYEQLNSGGGGGIGNVGNNGDSLRPGAGGNGLYQSTINNVTYNFKNYFSPNTDFGVVNNNNYYIGGGGAGSGFTYNSSVLINGGLGGGGTAYDTPSDGSGMNGTSNTGSGGGAASYTNVSIAGSGGSGIVIIRFRYPINNTPIDTTAAVIKMNNTQVIPTSITSNDYYYAFTSTTDNYTFTSTQNITCDILMVGGGGGGSAGGVTIQSNPVISSVRKYPPTPLSGTTDYSDTERSQGFTTRQASGTPSYGAGNYTIYSSGWWNMNVDIHRNSKTPMKIFNGILDSQGWLSKVSSGNTGFYYEDSVGNYYGSDFIVSNYKGEWIKLKLPVSIYLSYIKLWGDNNGSTQFIPRNFKIYGSNDDGVTWIDIINVTGNLVSPCQTNDTHIISDNGVKRNTVAYNFYAIVISVGPRFVALGELEFWGSEVITPDPIIGGSGGGGAGSLIFIKSITLPIGIYTFTVGNGGARGTSGAGNKGGNTKIILNGTDILVAEGGGAGGGGNTIIGNGGSGGGGDSWTSEGSVGNANPGLATNPGSNIFSYNGVTGVKYGNDGGIVDTTINIGAGGGGAGTNGYANTSNQGVYRAFGGNGRNNAIINNITYDFVTVFGTTLYGTNDDNNNTRYFAGGGGASGVTIQGNSDVISSVRKYPPTPLSGTTDYSDTERSQGFTTRQASGTPSYGAGNYTIYSSGWWNMNVDIHRNSKTPMKIFNGILDSQGWLSKVSSGNTGFYYEDSVGNYYGSDFIVSNYKGEWIKLKLPVSIYLSYIKLWGDNNGSTQFIPRNFKIYGSNDDGVTWIDIINVTGNLVSPCQTNDTHIISDNGVKRNTVAYNFYAIVISVGPRFVALGELEFWGSEVITPASDSWLGSYGGKGGGGGTNNTGGRRSSGTNNTGSGGAGGNVNIPSGDGGSGIILLKLSYPYIKSYTTTFSNDATFGYKNTDTTFNPAIVQLNTGQTLINSLSQYINFNFANVNKCKMDASGNLTLNGDIFIYSDGRIKENVTTITSALDKVNELSGITYNIINKPKKQVGVIAQEVEKVLPEVVKYEGEIKTVAYPNMVGLLIEALKELNDKVDQTL